MKILFLVISVLLAACEKSFANMPVGVQLSPNDTTSIKYLALGDSYTIGTAIGEENAYPHLLANKLGAEGVVHTVDLEVIAKNGWTTDNLLNGISIDKPASDQDLVTLLIGVNNQYQGKSKLQYRRQFRQLLEMAIGFAQNDTDHVFVLSIPDWGVTPAAGNRNALETADDIDAFNQINKEITDSLGVTWFDITPVSRAAALDLDLVAKDKLHFSTEMHGLWLDIIYKKIKAEIED